MRTLRLLWIGILALVCVEAYGQPAPVVALNFAGVISPATHSSASAALGRMPSTSRRIPAASAPSSPAGASGGRCRKSAAIGTRISTTAAKPSIVVRQPWPVTFTA